MENIEILTVYSQFSTEKTTPRELVMQHFLKASLQFALRFFTELLTTLQVSLVVVRAIANNSYLLHDYQMHILLLCLHAILQSFHFNIESKWTIFFKKLKGNQIHMCSMKLHINQLKWQMNICDGFHIQNGNNCITIDAMCL